MGQGQNSRRKNAFTKIWSKIKGAWNSAIKWVTGKFLKVWNFFKKYKVGSITGALLGTLAFPGIGTIAGAIGGAYIEKKIKDWDIIGRVKKFGTRIWTKLKELWPSVRDMNMAGIKKWVKDIGKKIWDWMKEAALAVWEGVKATGRWFKRAGK